MATSIVTVSKSNYPDTLSKGLGLNRLFGTIAIGAGTYLTNGLPVVFSGISPASSGDVAFVVLTSIAGNIYTYDPVNKTIRVYSAYATEYTNGATIGAGITGDTIYFAADINKC